MKNLKQIITVITVAVFMLGSNNVNAQKSSDEKAKIFEESVAIVTLDRLYVNKKQSAKRVRFENFNSKFQLPKVIKICEVELRDDGKGYDKKANDGIYTSVKLYENLNAKIESKTYVFKNFKYANKVKGKPHFVLDCYTVYIGIPIVVCSIHIEF